MMRLLCFLRPRFCQWPDPPGRYSLFNRQGESAIVVAGPDSEAGARSDSLLVQELQELAVPLINADHLVSWARLCFTQETYTLFRRSSAILNARALAWGQTPLLPSFATSCFSNAVETACSSRSASS